MGQLPVGAAFGTVVHRVLEAVDTGADDLAGELRRCCADVLGRRLASDLVPDELAAALLPPMRTPLGRLAGDRPLAGVAPGDRLTELEFELPLSAGDRPTEGAATLAFIADMLHRHLSGGDPLASYADMLQRGVLPAPPLRGYLTGSIDAVLRVRPHGDDTRYVVVDYKTNWLGGFDADGSAPLTAWDYRPAELAAAMIEANYPLQALLYSVALHRYLRWRQPSYDPARHLGGALYLFLRGMCGPQAPTPGGAPAGVFAWRPPADLIVALSDLLDRGPA
jgi:exodeoxyribonuclease V beta subunit